MAYLVKIGLRCAQYFSDATDFAFSCLLLFVEVIKHLFFLLEESLASSDLLIVLHL